MQPIVEGSGMSGMNARASGVTCVVRGLGTLFAMFGSSPAGNVNRAI
jgi:hypothetical protein